MAKDSEKQKPPKKADKKKTDTSSDSTKSVAKKRKLSLPEEKQAKVPKLESSDVVKVQPGASGVVSDMKLSGDLIQRISQQRKAVCESVAQFKFNKKRVRVITESDNFKDDAEGVLYWMSRDQRVQDNWAFLFAQRLALKLEVPLHVCFCLVPKFLDATIRQFGFMLKGLAEVEKECRALNIPFHLLTGTASSCIPNLLKEHKIGGVITDFSPLRVPMKWVTDLKNSLPKDVPLCQVDAHNLVPCWEASPKLEYGARTIRNKIHKQLEQFSTEFPPLVSHPHLAEKMPPAVDWQAAMSYLEVDRSVTEVTWAAPGSEPGLRTLESFCESRLKYFATQRNDPTKEALSNLSPWLHFGQVSAQRCILTVNSFRNKYKESVDAFVEETIIRRELADNFCFYNEHYDSLKGAYEWARKTLEAHRGDKRPYLYSKEQLEQAKTHDDLWNAAQRQMVQQGKMHGFLRMYWAKKILEWTKSPEEALEVSIYLNDKYNLDGRDPNGYVGCMWSICGIHDQGWMERNVFGKIRYMNYEGCKRKFDVAAFVRRYSRVKT